MAASFNTLIIEDDEADACVLERALDGASCTSPGHFAVVSERTLEAALARLAAAAFDVILLDLGLPDSQGLDTLRTVRGAASASSIVVLSATTDVELGLSALELGAQDLLPKDELRPALVARTLRYAIERRRAEARLLLTLRQRELLSAELNHRAKNNLQVVTAMLSMQARRSEDANFRALVQSARGRVEAMARAHEQLSSSSDRSRIDFSSYLRRLSTFIYSVHDGEGRGIVLELDVEHHELPLDRAVTAGLVVNELLTNSFKHAFSDARQGRIWLRLRAREQRLELTLEDNGIGLPREQAPGSRLGLSLVATLAEQLDAALECDPGPGTRLRLTFAHGDPG